LAPKLNVAYFSAQLKESVQKTKLKYVLEMTSNTSIVGRQAIYQLIFIKLAKIYLG
jgi:hypothetical protein